MSENTQNVAPVCPAAATPEPEARPVGRPRIGKMTQREQKLARNRKRRQRERERETEKIETAAVAEKDHLDTVVIKEDEAKRILKDTRGVSAEHLDLVYELAVDAANELKLPANRFWFAHGCAKTSESNEAGKSILIEPIQDDDVEGQLLRRRDLHAIWDYSVSWREHLDFDGYLKLIFDIKDGFFTLVSICEKDFDYEGYAEWVALMPKLDPKKLRRGYTQREMRDFLNSSEVKQRLLVAARNSMKSSFVRLWIVQLILICPDCRILIVTETQPLARTAVSEVKHYFEVGAGGPTRLQYLFPSYCVPEGDGKAIEFKNPMAHLHLTIGVACSSMESGGFAGQRNDFVWFDDPLSENTVTNEDSIRKTITKYDAIRKLSEVGGLGSLTTLTPWAMNDLGAELQTRNEQAEKEGDFTFLAYRIDPAFVIKPEALAKAKDNLLSLTANDVILRFKRLDWKFLRGEMMSGRAENFKFFKAQCLCRWDSFEDEQSRCSFTEEDLKTHTKPLSEFEPYTSHSVIDTVLSVDVAWRTDKYSDFSALALTTICKWDGGRTVAIVRDCHMGRHKLPELAVLIVEAIHQKNPSKVVIEKAGSWETLRDEILKAAMLRNYILTPIYWRATNLGGAAAKSKALRIKTTCESMLHNDELYFVQAPWNDALFSQFVAFDGVSESRMKKNDGPDAISIGLECAFPSVRLTQDSEEREKQEESQRNALAMRLQYNTIFGNNVPSMPTTNTLEPPPDRNARGSFGIPGLRSTIPGAPTPTKQIGFSSIMRKPSNG